MTTIGQDGGRGPANRGTRKSGEGGEKECDRECAKLGERRNAGLKSEREQVARILQCSRQMDLN